MAWVRPVPVTRQPDRVRPGLDVGFARSEVRDSVADLDLGALDRLGRGYHVPHHQVRQWQRIHIDRVRRPVVAFVRPLVHLAGRIRDHENLHLPAVSLRHRHRTRNRRVSFTRLQGRLVGLLGNQNVVVADESVQRQVDPVHPVLAGRGDGPLVDDHELHGECPAGIDFRRRRDRLHLQVGSCLDGHRKGLIVRNCVVGRLTVFVDLAPVVRHHDRPVHAGDVKRQEERLVPLVVHARRQRAVIRERPQLDLRAARVPFFLEIDLIRPGAGRLARTSVLHTPRQVDRAAFFGHRRGHDVRNRQVRPGRQGDRHGARDPGVIVGVNELERPACRYHHVVSPRQAVGDPQTTRPLVGTARRKMPHVAEAVDVRDLVAPVRVACQVHRVRPVAPTGLPDALVAHDPTDRHGLTAPSVRGRRDQLNIQIGVGNRHHVEPPIRLGCVIVFSPVLEHLSVRVALHEVRFDEQVISPHEAGRKQHAFRPGITMTARQSTGPRKLSQQVIVAVADGLVLGGDDRVIPGSDSPGTFALIADRPGDDDLRRVADGPRRRLDVADHKIRVGQQRDSHHHGLGIVVLGIAGGVILEDLVEAIDLNRHFDIANASDPIR